MNIGFELNKQLSHLFATQRAREHQRRPAKLISLLNISAELYQAAHARELVFLYSEGDGCTAFFVNRVHVSPLANQRENRVKRTTQGGNMNWGSPQKFVLTEF